MKSLKNIKPSVTLIIDNKKMKFYSEQQVLSLLNGKTKFSIRKPISYTLSQTFDTFALGVQALREQGKAPFSMKENIKARLKDKSLFNSWLDSCTAIVCKANDDEFLIVPKCELLINIDKDYNKPSIILSDDEYAKLKKQKGTVVLNRKEVKCDELLTLQEVKEHKVWLALCEGDKKLLSDYAEYYFREFNKDKAMRFWVQNKSGKNELRSVVFNYDYYLSLASGNGDLNLNSRFVSR